MEDIFEEPVVDIDSCDAKNPLAVTDYVEDLYAYYKKVEVVLAKLTTIQTFLASLLENYSQNQ